MRWGRGAFGLQGFTRGWLGICVVKMEWDVVHNANIHNHTIEQPLPFWINFDFSPWFQHCPVNIWHRLLTGPNVVEVFQETFVIIVVFHQLFVVSLIKASLDISITLLSSVFSSTSSHLQPLLLPPVVGEVGLHEVGERLAGQHYLLLRPHFLEMIRRDHIWDEKREPEEQVREVIEE